MEFAQESTAIGGGRDGMLQEDWTLVQRKKRTPSGPHPGDSQRDKKHRQARLRGPRSWTGNSGKFAAAENAAAVAFKDSDYPTPTEALLRSKVPPTTTDAQPPAPRRKKFSWVQHAREFEARSGLAAVPLDARIATVATPEATPVRFSAECSLRERLEKQVADLPEGLRFTPGGAIIPARERASCSFLSFTRDRSGQGPLNAAAAKSMIAEVNSEISRHVHRSHPLVDLAYIDIPASDAGTVALVHLGKDSARVAQCLASLEAELPGFKAHDFSDDTVTESLAHLAEETKVTGGATSGGIRALHARFTLMGNSVLRGSTHNRPIPAQLALRHACARFAALLPTSVEPGEKIIARGGVTQAQAGEPPQNGPQAARPQDDVPVTTDIASSRDPAPVSSPSDPLRSLSGAPIDHRRSTQASQPPEMRRLYVNLEHVKGYSGGNPSEVVPEPATGDPYTLYHGEYTKVFFDDGVPYIFISREDAGSDHLDAELETRKPTAEMDIEGSA